MALSFKKDNKELICEYYPEMMFNLNEKKAKTDGKISIKRTFHVPYNNAYIKNFNELPQDDGYVEEIIFKVGERHNNEYYLLDKEVFGISNEILIHEDVKIDVKMFISYRNISIMKIIDEIIGCKFVINNDEKYYENNEGIPESEFKKLIKTFPNNHETTLYVRKRINSILANYVQMNDAYNEKYNTYIERKEQRLSLGQIKINNIPIEFIENEIGKYKYILAKMEYVLLDYEKSGAAVSEKTWEKIILPLILLLFPNHIYTFNAVDLEIAEGDFKEMDYVLIDGLDYIDIIEIKVPYKDLLIDTKYRENYVPNAELAKTVMQVENYLYHLSRVGEKGEKKIKEILTKKIEKESPEMLEDFESLDIKISNPKGTIITGRSKNFNPAQKHAFRLLQHTYSNIVNIYTYDNLIEIVKRKINKFERMVGI